MSGTSGFYRYRVNGVIDTNNTVMANLEALGNSAGSWLTYDSQDGKWAVVINRARTVDAYFDDDNIVGSINVNGTGLDNFYNSVEVQFPHRDLNDQSDWINIEIPDEDRNPNEPDKTLTLNYPLVNEPVQAQMLGLIELKQSRVDLIVNFTTDFSAINTAAGDVIAITNTVYGWDEKEFRVISVTESENESGITLQITALEYDSAVYSVADLYRYLRTNEDGIIAIGAIGQPGTPEVTKYERLSRPGIIVESTVPDNTDPDTPSGIVEGMEFWIYSIPSGELPTWEAVDDDTRSYTLYRTINPASGSVLTAGDNIVLDIDDFDPGNFLVKTRAVNSVTTGPFSDHSGLVEYAPVQTTDAINPSTKVVDANGANIVGALTASGLLALLKGLMADGSTGSGSVYKKIFDTYNTATSKDLSQALTGVQYTATISSGTTATQLAAMSSTTDTTYYVYQSANYNNRSNWISTSVTIPAGWGTFQAEIKTPTCVMSYKTQVQDQSSPHGPITVTSSVYAQPAFTVAIYKGSTLSSATVVAESTIDWTSNYSKLVVVNPAADTYWVTLKLIPTYDLNLYWTGRSVPANEVYFYNFSSVGDTNFTMAVTKQ